MNSPDLDRRELGGRRWNQDAYFLGNHGFNLEISIFVYAVDSQVEAYVCVIEYRWLIKIPRQHQVMHWRKLIAYA